MGKIKKKKKSPKYIEVERLFYNYENIKRELEYINEEIEFLKNDITGCKSISYNEKVQTSINNESIIEKEIEEMNKKIEILEIEKYKKEKDLKRINRAKENFNKDEEAMFNIRYVLKIKNWDIYADKTNVGKEKYYIIKEKMINKSIKIMFPYYNFKNVK